MRGTKADKVHIDTVIGLFEILELDVIDADTMVATYEIPRDLAVDTLERGEQLGCFGSIDGGGYELTARGRRMQEDVTVRGGSRASLPS